MDTSNLPDPGFNWKRPQNVPVPNIWHRFETRPKNGKTYKIRIEDVTLDRFEEVIEFMMMYYFNDEPLSVSSKLLEDEVSVMVYQYVLSKALEQGASVIAVLDEESSRPQIVALQILSVACKSDPQLPEVPGDAINKLKQVYYDIRTNVDPFEVLNTDTYLHDWGLCVDPQYRGMNIGYNILATLEKLVKAFNIRGAMIMFTRIESQILASRLGYKLYSEIVYNDYKDENGELIFPVKEHKSLKFMGIKYE